MKSSLNQLSVDCTDTGSESDREGESVLLSSLSLSATYFTSRQSKCFSFFSCSLSLYLFFCFSLKFTHYRINTYVYARSSSSSSRLLCSLANFCQLTEAQSHVHRPCVCRHFLACVARVSISRCFLWLYGQPW